MSASRRSPPANPPPGAISWPPPMETTRVLADHAQREHVVGEQVGFRRESAAIA
ncbi:hypothetical protein [Nonomuraea bangladeshensis]|uniref:hypothetical protein n=1 Tax=Nonomuraea bangladeshensis TaxID=404385 RepID=UPI0031E2D7A2